MMPPPKSGRLTTPAWAKASAITPASDRHDHSRYGFPFAGGTDPSPWWRSPGERRQAFCSACDRKASGKISALRTNHVQMQQLLFNLIKNAIEAMEAVTEGSRELQLRTEVDVSGNLTIVIQDSGTGINPKNIDRIFDPFFTTKSQSMGMGLSICRAIAEAHDGHLWVEPGVHQGS